MNGKGSKTRPTNLKKFQKNWDQINWKTTNQRVLDIIKKTQPMVDAREREILKEAEKDANNPESTVERMMSALDILLKGYKGFRK